MRIYSIPDIPYVGVVIFHFIVVAIAEEVMIRSVLMHELQKSFNTAWTVIIGSAIFAFAYHSGGDVISNILVRFPLGIGLGVLRVYTGNIYNSTLAHFWYNILVSTLFHP